MWKWNTVNSETYIAKLDVGVASDAVNTGSAGSSYVPANKVMEMNGLECEGEHDG